jgi:hypothetical protein
LDTILHTGQLPLQSAVCTWAVAHRDANPSSDPARLYWNNVIKNLTFRSIELDPSSYVSLVNQSDSDDPFVIFADPWGHIARDGNFNDAAAWKVIHPDNGGVAQARVVVDSYSFYFSWSYKGIVYRTETYPIEFSPAKEYLVKITETELQISVDDPTPPIGIILITILNKISRVPPPVWEPLFLNIVADGSDILVVDTHAFPIGSGLNIDREFISRLSKLSVFVRQKAKPRLITPGKTYVLFKTEDMRYNILVNDGLYKSLCPHGIFPVSTVSAIHFE